MPISVSCGEIGTEFGVESFKQSLFHRNLSGNEKGGGPGEGLRLCYKGRCYSQAAGLDQASVDRLGDLGGVGRTLDGGTEILVHERLGDLGQDLEVRGSSLSARDEQGDGNVDGSACLLYTSPSPRDA